MKNTYLSSLLALASLVLAGFLFLSFQPSNAGLAKAFLDSLEPEQRAKVMLDMDDNQRYNWHFFPGRMLPRPGITLKERRVSH